MAATTVPAVMSVSPRTMMVAMIQRRVSAAVTVPMTMAPALVLVLVLVAPALIGFHLESYVYRFTGTHSEAQ